MYLFFMLNAGAAFWILFHTYVMGLVPSNLILVISLLVCAYGMKATDPIRPQSPLPPSPPETSSRA